MNHIFLVAGQSNASGRGNLVDVPTYSNASRIFMYGNDNVFEQASEPLDSNSNQVDTKSSDGNAGAGFAIPFANKLLDDLDPSDTITLVPAALGGSSIASWRPLWTDAHLYGSAINRMYEAKDAAIEDGKDSKFSGILWWQGEAETSSAALANMWPERTTEVLSHMRLDLCDLTLPIALCSLNTVYPNTSPYNYWSYLVNNYMTPFNMHHLKVISTDVVGHSASNLHYTTAEYIVIGERMADAIYPLM